MPPRKPLLPLEPVPELIGVHRARRGAAAMAAFALREGGLAVYSPVTGLTPETIARMENLGGVRALIAPSHFHHLGLKEYLEAFPDASLFAPEAGHARLHKQTGLSFNDVAALSTALSDGVEFHLPPGLKAQEVWVQARHAEQSVLAVCDAFGASAKEDGLPPSEASTRGAFKTMCLKDAELYRSWALEYFAQINITHLLPCHGARVTGPGLSQHLMTSLEDL